LIYSFQMQTMMQLGKLANPMTSKIEKELDGAKVTIDMLDMLKAKTKGNIADDESKFLEQVIADLKLNYVEERDKEKSNSDAENISGKEKSPAEEKPPVEKDNPPAEEKKDSEKPDSGQTSETDNPIPPQE
jgi:Domain of unknown function (DUF1844)